MLCTTTVLLYSALTERRWVLKELLGDKSLQSQNAACAILLSSLVHAAIVGKQLNSATEEQQFKELTKPLLQSVLQRLKAGLAKECESEDGAGYSELLFSVASAMQLLNA